MNSNPNQQALLKELQMLVENYQNMTPQEKSQPATYEDVGACFFLCWSILNSLINETTTSK